MPKSEEQERAQFEAKFGIRPTCKGVQGEITSLLVSDVPWWWFHPRSSSGLLQAVRCGVAVRPVSQTGSHERRSAMKPSGENPVGQEKQVEHTEILTPSLKWGPEAFRDRHLTTEDDEYLLFDPRCPKCVEEWTEAKIALDSTRLFEDLSIQEDQQ